MAFRRQDIPKTTRKGNEGEHRRLHPRFIRDRTVVPKIDLAIGYLDGMVGRKRGDLSPDVVLELFGDPKLARCVLTCLAESYRYRTPEMAEVIGEDAAGALTAWDIMTPADLRAHLYRAANAELGGFVADTDRAAFLERAAGPLGVGPDLLAELIHLDAERNAILVRIGPRPVAEDVVARYNAMLCVSVLRHAAAIELDLPGLDPSTVETVCGRSEVGFKRIANESVRLGGRRNAHGSFAGFGARVARCAVQLIALCPKTPSGRAVVYLDDRPLAFALDAKSIAPLRPKLRAVAGSDGVVRTAILVEEIAALRRKTSGATNGWTLRRHAEPIAVDGALAVPELVLTRGQTAIAVVPVPAGAGRAEALAALELVNRVRPAIALGIEPGAAEVPALAVPHAAALVDLLEQVADGLAASPTPLGTIRDELADHGWVTTPRLAEILGESSDPAPRLAPLLDDGEAALVPGFGLCRVVVLDELVDRLVSGPLDIARLRADVSAAVGEGSGVDALTLHLLGRQTLVGLPGSPTAPGGVDVAA